MKKTNKIKNYSLKAKLAKKKKAKGFTLVELIVVIAIIGVLAVVLIPNMLSYVKKARLSTANDAASKIGEQANLIAAEMEMEGKTLSGTYSASVTLTSTTDTVNATAFSDALNKAVDIKTGAWVTITFGSNGQVSNVVYRESASASYIGAYPTAITMKEIEDNEDKLDTLYTTKGGVKGSTTTQDNNNENGGS